MKLAFCLFKYFPFGGLQRDFLNIMRECIERGHEVAVFTSHWEGECDKNVNVTIIPIQGIFNHSKNLSFYQQLQKYHLRDHYDLIIGFNKMPGLDVYYAADVCYQARIRQERCALYRLLPRYQQQLAFEQAVFAEGNRTHILLIAKAQQALYQRYYQTEAERFHYLPPGIARNDLAKDAETVGNIRSSVRPAHNITDNMKLLLMVGSAFKTKGVDRAIKALSALPVSLKQQCQLWIVGKGNAKSFVKLAKHLQVNNQVHFLGGRHDVAELMIAADLLIHPAYHENTGTVLLEALAAGLPVLTVDTCGYAPYVRESQAGQVIMTPFKQDDFNNKLQEILMGNSYDLWHVNALDFAKKADIYNMPAYAVDVLEELGKH